MKKIYFNFSKQKTLWTIITITIPNSVVAVAFQSVFHSEIYQNNIFFIFKKLFLTSTHQNDSKTPKNINLKQKKKSNFYKTLLKHKTKEGWIPYSSSVACFFIHVRFLVKSSLISYINRKVHWSNRACFSFIALLHLLVKFFAKVSVAWKQPLPQA